MGILKFAASLQQEITGDVSSRTQKCIAPECVVYPTAFARLTVVAQKVSVKYPAVVKAQDSK